MKIGVMFGNPKPPPAEMRSSSTPRFGFDIRRIDASRKGRRRGQPGAKVKVVKNKVAAPFREAEFDIIYAAGVSKTGELIDIGVDRKIVEKSGAWFSYGGERIGQGREAAKEYLKAHPRDT